MSGFNDWPIKRKLTAIIMLASGFALTMASVTLVTNDLVTTKENLVDEMYVLAEVLGDNSVAALTFNDNEAAAMLLRSTSRHPNIVAAAIVDRNKQIFATYQNPAAPAEVISAPQSSAETADATFHGAYLDVINPIVLDGERIGWVVLRSNLNDLEGHLQRSLRIALALLGIAGVLAYAVASRLQRVISAPIQALAHTMKQVSDDKDYSLRVAQCGARDELGLLTEGFNEMLRAVQLRDDTLAVYRQQLEHEVKRRTEELSNSLQTVKEQRHFLGSMVESLPIMVFVKDSQDLKLIQWNHACEDLTGFLRDEMLGTHGHQVFDVDGTGAFLDHERTVLSDRVMVDLHDKVIHTKLQGPRNVSMKQLPIVDAQGTPRYLLGIAEDITDRKRADEALRTSELRLSLTVKGAQIGIWDWNLISNSVYYSPEWKGQLGYTDEEVTNIFQEWESRVHPDDLPRALNAIDDYLQHRTETYDFEHRLRHKDGAYRWILTRGALFDDPVTLSKRMVGIHIDVTEQKQVQEALRTAKEHAEAASVAKSQFLANMSHEIRTPMNGVLGMTELLLGTQLSDRQRHMAATIHGSGTSLLAIINDILDFSKIEAGKLELERVEFGLRQTVEEAVELFAEPSAKKGLELTCFLSKDLPDAVFGDPVRLRQILLNLVGNAVKFTERGDVSVRMRCLSAEDERVLVKCEVQDTGIGISAEAQTRLFAAFSQADGSTTRRFGGTGLGLAIVKQLVQVMGGAIGIESVPGQGSTFWFTVELGYAPSAQVVDATGSHSLAGARILIVDDNAINREILETQLTGWEAETISASSGIAALERLTQAVAEGKPVDMAILDIHMPEMDGLMLSQAIKADPALRHIPLLALSSVDHQADVPESVNFAAWLRKPVRQSLLRDCLLRQRFAATETTVRQEGPGSPLTFRGRVLVTEDNPVNREVALGMLELLGCEVDQAENGQQALEAVSTQRYDLILMDCQMPVMDGFAATAAIRNQEGAVGTDRHVPIIALTANAMEGDRERCLAAGMDDYLSKPFTQHDLQAALHRWMATPPKDHLPVEQHSTPQAMAEEPMISTAPVELSVLDEAVWNNLLAMERAGRRNAVQNILSLYLVNARRLLAEIREALHASDASALHAGAHQLKSASAQVGALAVSALAADIERLAQANQLITAADLLTPLEAHIELVCRRIEDKLRPYAA